MQCATARAGVAVELCWRSAASQQHVGKAIVIAVKSGDPVFCLQCAATIAVIRRETNSLRWPVFAWVYMTGLGYLGALLAFQLGS